MRRGAVRQAGFTLVEVMVALAIVAIALVAGLKATAALTFNAERQSDMLRAQICAENALVALRLQAQLPALGESTLRCEQGGQPLEVVMTVAPTPNPNFRRVDAQVRRAQDSLMTLSTVVGRY